MNTDIEVRTIGDEIVAETLAFVREEASGGDEAWLRGYAEGKISVAVVRLGADYTKAAAAQQEIRRLTTAIRSEA